VPCLPDCPETGTGAGVVPVEECDPTATGVGAGPGVFDSAERAPLEGIGAGAKLLRFEPDATGSGNELVLAVAAGRIIGVGVASLVARKLGRRFGAGADA